MTLLLLFDGVAPVVPQPGPLWLRIRSTRRHGITGRGSRSRHVTRYRLVPVFEAAPAAGVSPTPLTARAVPAPPSVKVGPAVRLDPSAARGTQPAPAVTAGRRVQPASSAVAVGQVEPDVLVGGRVSPPAAAARSALAPPVFTTGVRVSTPPAGGRFVLGATQVHLAGAVSVSPVALIGRGSLAPPAVVVSARLTASPLLGNAVPSLTVVTAAPRVRPVPVAARGVTAAPAVSSGLKALPSPLLTRGVPVGPAVAIGWRLTVGPEAVTGVPPAVTVVTAGAAVVEIGPTGARAVTTQTAVTAGPRPRPSPINARAELIQTVVRDHVRVAATPTAAAGASSAPRVVATYVVAPTFVRADGTTVPPALRWGHRVWVGAETARGTLGAVSASGGISSPGPYSIDASQAFAPGYDIAQAFAPGYHAAQAFGDS